MNTESIEALLPDLPDHLRWVVENSNGTIKLMIVEDKTFLFFWKKEKTVRDAVILDTDIDEGFVKMMVEITIINMMEGLK